MLRLKSSITYNAAAFKGVVAATFQQSQSGGSGLTLLPTRLASALPFVVLAGLQLS